MIVTTAITAVTPTTMPINVNAVRSLLARRLPVATRKASQIAVKRRSISHKKVQKAQLMYYAPEDFLFLCLFVALLDSFVFLDLTVANRDYAVGSLGNVMLVGDD